jgi:CBS domain-containing protein
MNVHTILRNKGKSVVTIHPDATVERAVAVLRLRGIGALVVSDDGENVVGILSERDIVHGLGSHGVGLLERRVEELMTKTVVTCGPHDRVADLMALMTERRIRHLPVLRNGKLAGLISIGDVVKNRLDEIELETTSLKAYVAGAA